LTFEKLRREKITAGPFFLISSDEKGLVPSHFPVFVEKLNRKRRKAL
jgi:hypothetical protein